MTAQCNSFPLEKPASPLRQKGEQLRLQLRPPPVPVTGLRRMDVVVHINAPRSTVRSFRQSSLAPPLLLSPALVPRAGGPDLPRVDSRHDPLQNQRRASGSLPKGARITGISSSRAPPGRFAAGGKSSLAPPLLLSPTLVPRAGGPDLPRVDSRHDPSNQKESRSSLFDLERITGIEPASSAWEADILPMNYIRDCPFIIV